MIASTTLRSRRCLLRPARLDDLDALESAVGAPQFPPNLPLAAIHAEDGLARWLAGMCDRAARGDGWIWSFELHDHPGCLGQVSLLPIPDAEAWRLAFWLTPTHWRRGLAREAVATVLQDAFVTKALPEIRAGAALWNQSSLRTLRSVGMRAVQINEDGYRIGGVPYPVCEHVIARVEWLRMASADAKGGAR
jgi:RimJ/RimL family protein N-acetyltransferase